MDELKIQETPDEIFDLETLITEGADARIPIEIEFPNGKKAAGLITPISTNEFSRIYNTGGAAEILVNIVEAGLLNKNGEHLPRNLIESMPLGVTSKISNKICVISGIELNPTDNISAEDLMKDMESFPELS